MTTPVEAPSLVDWLEACIATDEALIVDDGWAIDCEGAYGMHLLPERARAECEAKRRIVARHTGDHVCPEPRDPQGSSWLQTRYERDGYELDGAGLEVPHYELVTETIHVERPCGDLRDLAAVYADRPGFREEWRS